MSPNSDKHGQVMLTSAFLLAITLTIVALMLNNVIYYNNISYMGFMDHSGYDDVSIKKMVAEEATFAYNESRGDQITFDMHMADFIRSINNLTIPKGSYVTFKTQPIASYSPTGTYKSTESLLTIRTRDSNKTYLITTNYTPHVASPPGPGYTPLNCVVYISANKTQMIVGGHDRAEVTVQVYDKTTLVPLSGVTVKLRSSLLGGFYDEYGTTDRPEVITNEAGQAKAYYFPTGVGIEVLNASVGTAPSHADGNLSDNFTIQCQLQTQYCNSHIVKISTPLKTYYEDHPKAYVIISIPIKIDMADNPTGFNFSNFMAGAVFNSGGSDNLKLTAHCEITNITETGYVRGPGSYSNNVAMKLLIDDKDQGFTASVTIVITAYCEEDDRVYIRTETFDVIGTTSEYPPW